jgi:hypothetical protein
MVIDDFNVPSMTITPFKTDAPLAINANTPLARPVAR